MKRITPAQYSKLLRKSMTPIDDSVSGFCGRIQDNVVNVPGKKNWIYVTLSKGGAIVQARNRFAPPAFGMAVILRPMRNDPLHFEVEDVRHTVSDDFDFVLLPNHAENHDWRSPDETRTDLRQFLPLRVLPARAGGIAVDIHSGRYETAAGKSAKYAGVTSLSLTAYQPATGSVYLLIELDNTGTLKYSTSTNKDPALLLESDIPARTAGRAWLASVKLYGGQTSLRDSVTNTDLIDLRLSEAADGLSSISVQTDQSGGTSDTYGVLAGLINGSNKVYTVSLAGYVTGALTVFLNGQLQTQGTAEDWTETSPAAGTFTFITAPLSGDLLIVTYQKTSGASGNADTLDGFHASAFRKRPVVVTVTANYTATITDETIIVNSATPVTITLPPATGSAQPLAVKSINTGMVTIDGNSTDTIDDELTQPVIQWEDIYITDYATGKWAIV